MENDPTASQPDGAKNDRYAMLAGQLRELLRGEPDFVANAANMASLVYHGLRDVNWVGFYWLKQGQLVLGPFQGKPACTRIALGRGVCGTVAQRRTTLIVSDVGKFPGHIACDSASRSEIVLPLIVADRLLGVFDLDSAVVDRFGPIDQSGLERLVKIFLEMACESIDCLPCFLD